jgi:hypothetical protein
MKYIVIVKDCEDLQGIQHMIFLITFKKRTKMDKIHVLTAV